ncbi:MAG: hypothetical protein R2832_12900 [Rhodothermales bacterium]
MSAQVVIRERVEVQAPNPEPLAAVQAGPGLPFVDCGVARGAVPPELTRYLDAVGGPNRLIVKRDGILRIESIGGFAEFVRPNGPSTDPTVEKPINGIVTITNDAGEVVAVIDLSSLPRTDARNRSYSCQTSGPIYYVTRNTFGQAIRIDVAVTTGIYDVSFACSNCTQEGSAVTEAFFAPDTYTDALGASTNSSSCATVALLSQACLLFLPHREHGYGDDEYDDPILFRSAPSR